MCCLCLERGGGGFTECTIKVYNGTDDLGVQDEEPSFELLKPAHVMCNLFQSPLWSRGHASLTLLHLFLISSVLLCPSQLLDV